MPSPKPPLITQEAKRPFRRYSANIHRSPQLFHRRGPVVKAGRCSYTGRARVAAFRQPQCRRARFGGSPAISAGLSAGIKHDPCTPRKGKTRI
ncbi:hypothetical protein Q9966_000095 [Columba livia]|nr:hypothetical protein Q9966_000095 [Columba livia]